MANLKKQIIPNLFFIVMVIVVPVFLMFISLFGAETEALKIVLR